MAKKKVKKLKPLSLGRKLKRWTRSQLEKLSDLGTSENIERAKDELVPGTEVFWDAEVVEDE